MLLALPVMALLLGIASVAHAQSTAPTISTVAITSSPGSDNTYVTGDIITVSLTFSEAVTVDTTDGTPFVRLNIGGYNNTASYSGDGSSAVVQSFSYTVEPLGRDSNGVSLPANSLVLNRSTIQATDDSANATLTHSAMSFPSHKVAAAGELLVGLAQVGIPVGTALNNDGRSTSNVAWQWQRSATEAGVYSDIPAAEGGTSSTYTPSAGDLGMWLKATVTYDDSTGTGWAADWTQRVLSRPTLSNAAYAHTYFYGYVNDSDVTHLYAQPFTTGAHTRGYLLKGLRLALFRAFNIGEIRGNSAAGAWAVHANDAGKPAAEPLSAALPILSSDIDEKDNTFEEFTHPDGIHLDPDTKYWIVISRTTPANEGAIGIGAFSEWDGSLAAGLTTPPVDTGSDADWSLDFNVLSHYGNNPDSTHDDNPDTALLPWVTLPYALELDSENKFVLRISLLAPPVVTVQFGESDYTVDEGNSVGVNVELSSDPKRTITIPITAMGEDGATSADYFVSPLSVTFNRGETTKTVTLTTTQDSIDDDDETVKLEFGSMPHSGVSAGTRDETTVSITDDDDPEVTVEFGADTYAVAEGGAQSVTVTLSADPERTVAVPVVVAANQGGATSADYSGVPSSVTFNAGQTSRTLTFRATDDTVDDDDESVKLAFGTLPSRVSQGARNETTVNIGDDDDPEVTVQFGADTYAVAEGGTQSVTVTLSADPERTVAIPLSKTELGGATSADYSGVPSSVTFNAGETSKSFTFNATDDTVDDDDESVRVEFGALPDRVSAGTRDQTTFNITDDDYPILTVQFGQDSQGVGEGETVNVTIILSANPERTVAIPVTSTPQGTASSADYSVPVSVTFNDGETEKTIAFTAQEDTVDDDDESVKLGFGSALPTRVTAGTRTETTLNIGDDDDPTVTVMFAQTTDAVGEGNTKQVSVSLSADPERTIIIPITTTHQSGATDADYLVPPSVTFNTGDMSKSIGFQATQDLIDDDGEGVKLGFGTMPDPRVSAGAQAEITVNINDDDTADIVLNPTALPVAEGGSSDFTVRLATEPTVNVTVAISGHAGTDLTLAGNRLNGDALTFTPDNWSVPQTVTVAAGQDLDGANDNGTLTHTAAGGEYDNVESALPVTVHDDDPPEIVIRLLELVVEESDSASYGVILATEPTVEVTVTITGLAGTDLSLRGPTLSGDALTFTADDWTTPQTVTVTAGHDDDTDGDTATLTHTSTGGEYTSITKTLPVTVDDNTGHLRLVDGTLTDEEGQLCEGRLEIYYDGAWGTICDDYWTHEDADVACRALGFMASVKDVERFKTGYFPAGDRSQEIVLDDMLCTGNESGLLECPSNHPAPRIHDCRHSEDVGLRCLKPGQAPPWIMDVEFSDPPGGNGLYDEGETLYVTLVWSEAVTVSTPPGGLPPKVWTDSAGIAEYASGSGARRTVFRNTVKSNNSSTSFSVMGIIHNTLRVRDGSITSVVSGLPAELGHSSYFSVNHLEQAEAAAIIGKPAFNDPGLDNAWSARETVAVILTFNRPVQVESASGVPSLAVLLGGTAARQAPYLRGSGSHQLVFGYTLTEADGTHNSLLVDPNALALNGGAIQDVANRLAAAIEHNGAGLILMPPLDDEEGPELQSATVDGATLTLTYNEELDTDMTPPAGAFAVTVNGSSRSLDSVSVPGTSVTLALVTAVEAGDTVTVDYTVPTEESVSKLQDLAGNAAASFSGWDVTNDTQNADPLTASVHGVPESHNGQDAFTFELRFSEAPKSDFNYTTVRDHAFTVVEGSVSNVRRLEPGKNVRWEITVEPDSNADVTIALNATTDCTAEGAICNADGRKLSRGLEIVVPGPQENSAATGAPTINGTAQVGETLSASTSGISDADGVANATFTYQWLADDTEISGATGSSYVVATAYAGKVIKVTVTFTDDAGNAETLTSAATTAVAKPPLTATVHGAPASHNGSNSFTFELRLSENIESLSFTTLHQHAFTVTGGSVSKARRLEAGKNVRWEITIQPSSNADVTIVLPTTTDCAAQGAICTSDGRKLSERVELTVSGPDG